jgi:hypothetical protein
MSKLRFHVVACSGEDAAFPARELNEHASSSKGYMTPKYALSQYGSRSLSLAVLTPTVYDRNCEYPQELVLRLVDGLCRITQVQLLSHQTHIATKIELFLTKASSLQDATYTRLGCVRVRPNEVQYALVFMSCMPVQIPHAQVECREQLYGARAQDCPH